MNESGLTPIASSRRLKPDVPTNGNTRNKNVRWSLVAHDSPRKAPEPSSPDMIGKLSVALNNMRNLKDQLSQRELELATAREEKDKYVQEHSKLYSQLTSIRTKCSVFEAQLARKSTENETLREEKIQLETEITRLRKMVSDDTSKQTARIKSLELQVNALKGELASRTADSNGEAVGLRSENGRLEGELAITRRDYNSKLQRLTVENSDLQEKINILVAKNDENRATILKLSSEKVNLSQEIERLRQEFKKWTRKHKESARVTEMEERLAELETERTNAKMALKKAMAILDQEDAMRKALEERDCRIAKLEEELKRWNFAQNDLSIPRSTGLSKAFTGSDAHDVRSIINQRLDEIQETKARLKQLTGRSAVV